MTAQRSRTFKAGTVVQYKSERRDYWCREGVAIANDHGALVDTFWESMGDAHILIDDEVSTATVLFRIDDYDELPHGHGYRWETYHPDDRREVTSQHGLRRRLFVRKGAGPDLPTQIANAHERLTEAESELRAAEYAVAYRRRELADLEAQAGQ